MNHKLSLDHEITSDVKDHTDKILKWAKTAQLFANNAQDFFAVTRATFNWESMPQYVIGRPAYDNCLVSQAVKNSELIFHLVFLFFFVVVCNSLLLGCCCCLLLFVVVVCSLFLFC